MRLALVVVAVGAGCGRIRFDVGGAPGGDALGGELDANSDAAVVATCNAITRFADDFEDGVQDGVWDGSYNDGGTTLGENGGDLAITLAANSAGAFGGYSTRRGYDLRGHRIMVEISQLPAPAAEAALAIRYDPSNSATIDELNGNIVAHKIIGNNFKQIATAPYDPVADKFWALSERGGSLYWETSADGVNFEEVAHEVSPFDLSLVEVTIEAGTSTSISNPGVARFAAYNGGVGDGSPACGAHTFHDDLNAGAFGHAWTTSTSPCCSLDETAGTAVIASDGTAGFEGLQSRAGLDLRETSISARVVSPPSGQLAMSLIARRDGNNQIDLTLRPAGIDAHFIVAGTATSSVTAWNPADVYWRLRETAGTAFWEVSPDAVTWTTLLQRAEPIPLDDVTFDLQAGLKSPAAADSAIFADVNVP